MPRGIPKAKEQDLGDVVRNGGTLEAKASPLSNAPVQGAQFHVGIQIGAHIVTGFDVDHFAKMKNTELSATLAGPGVLIEVKGGKRKLVPFSNLKEVELKA